MHRFLCYILRHPTFDSGGASKEIHAPTPYKPFDTSITNAHYAGSEGVILDGQMRQYKIRERQHFLSRSTAPTILRTILSGAMSRSEIHQRQ